MTVNFRPDPEFKAANGKSEIIWSTPESKLPKSRMKRLLKIGRMDTSVYPGDDSSLYDSSYKRHSCEDHMHKKVHFCLMKFIYIHLVSIWSSCNAQFKSFGIYLVKISCPCQTILYTLYYIAYFLLLRNCYVLVASLIDQSERSTKQIIGYEESKIEIGSTRSCE